MIRRQNMCITSYMESHRSPGVQYSSTSVLILDAVLTAPPPILKAPGAEAPRPTMMTSPFRCCCSTLSTYGFHSACLRLSSCSALHEGSQPKERNYARVNPCEDKEANRTRWSSWMQQKEVRTTVSRVNRVDPKGRHCCAKSKRLDRSEGAPVCIHSMSYLAQRAERGPRLYGYKVGARRHDNNNMPGP